MISKLWGRQERAYILLGQARPSDRVSLLALGDDQKLDRKLSTDLDAHYGVV